MNAPSIVGAEPVKVPSAVNTESFVNAPSRAQRLFGSAWFWVVFAGLGFAIWLSPLPRYQRPELPPKLGPAPIFTLLDQKSAAFGVDALKASIWIAAALPQTESAAAQKVATEMAHLQRKLRSIKERLFLLAIAQDAADTPQKLLSYAQAQAAQESRWRFLSSGESQATVVLSELFPQSTSAEFVLVDHEMTVRGRFPIDRKGSNALIHAVSLIIAEELQPAAR